MRALIFTICIGPLILFGSIGHGAPPSGAAVSLLEMPLFYSDWPKRRSGEALLTLSPVRELLSVFAEDVGQNIIVRYPGGDFGNLWALEFQEWLVALGVPSGYITLEPGSGGSDRLLILLEMASETLAVSTP
jgi:hypothetical protein